MRGHFSTHCSAFKKNGNPCRFAVAPGVQFCPNHDPFNDRHATARNAGSASAEARRNRRKPGDLLEAVLSLNDRESIQALLDTVARLTLNERISPERASIVLRACAIATRNFNPARETLAGPQPPSFDRLLYMHNVESLLLSIERLLPGDDEDPDDLDAGEP